jgi:hypothetical protein
MLANDCVKVDDMDVSQVVAHIKKSIP